MPSSANQKLWGISFETYYDAHFQELVADKLINCNYSAGDIWGKRNS
jgi:hypothetical protein